MPNVSRYRDSQYKFYYIFAENSINFSIMSAVLSAKLPYARGPTTIFIKVCSKIAHKYIKLNYFEKIMNSRVNSDQQLKILLHC